MRLEEYEVCVLTESYADMERRTIQMNFRVSESDEKMIRAKMEEVGIRSPGAYLRKMALDGYCVRLEIEGIKEAIFLLRNATNNLNQYAKQANITGAVYKKDMDELKVQLDEIWNVMKQILAALAKIK